MWQRLLIMIDVKKKRTNPDHIIASRLKKYQYMNEINVLQFINHLK